MSLKFSVLNSVFLLTPFWFQFLTALILISCVMHIYDRWMRFFKWHKRLFHHISDESVAEQPTGGEAMPFRQWNKHSLHVMNTFMTIECYFDIFISLSELPGRWKHAIESVCTWLNLTFCGQFPIHATVIQMVKLTWVLDHETHSSIMNYVLSKTKKDKC